VTDSDDGFAIAPYHLFAISPYNQTVILAVSVNYLWHVSCDLSYYWNLRAVLIFLKDVAVEVRQVLQEK